MVMSYHARVFLDACEGDMEAAIDICQKVAEEFRLLLAETNNHELEVAAPKETTVMTDYDCFRLSTRWPTTVPNDITFGPMSVMKQHFDPEQIATIKRREKAARKRREKAMERTARKTTEKQQ